MVKCFSNEFYDYPFEMMVQIAKKCANFHFKFSLLRLHYHICSNNLEQTIVLRMICFRNYKYGLIKQADELLQSFLSYSFLEIS